MTAMPIYIDANNLHLRQNGLSNRLGILQSVHLGTINAERQQPQLKKKMRHGCSTLVGAFAVVDG